MRELNRDKERGNGLIEFLGILVIFILPALIALVSLANVMNAHRYANVASREAVRSYTLAHTDSEGQQYMYEAIEQVFRNSNEVKFSTVELECSASPCLTPGETIHVRINAEVELAYLGRKVSVSATSSMPVDMFRAVG